MANKSIVDVDMLSSLADSDSPFVNNDGVMQDIQMRNKTIWHS